MVVEPLIVSDELPSIVTTPEPVLTIARGKLAPAVAAAKSVMVAVAVTSMNLP